MTTGAAGASTNKLQRFDEKEEEDDQLEEGEVLSSDDTAALADDDPCSESPPPTPPRRRTPPSNPANENLPSGTIYDRRLEHHRKSFDRRPQMLDRNKGYDRSYPLCEPRRPRSPPSQSFERKPLHATDRYAAAAPPVAAPPPPPPPPAPPPPAAASPTVVPARPPTPPAVPEIAPLLTETSDSVPQAAVPDVVPLPAPPLSPVLQIAPEVTTGSAAAPATVEAAPPSPTASQKLSPVTGAVDDPEVDSKPPDVEAAPLLTTALKEESVLEEPPIAPAVEAAPEAESVIDGTTVDCLLEKELLAIAEEQALMIEELEAEVTASKLKQSGDEQTNSSQCSSAAPRTVSASRRTVTRRPKKVLDAAAIEDQLLLAQAQLKEEERLAKAAAVAADQSSVTSSVPRVAEAPPRPQQPAANVVVTEKAKVEVPTAKRRRKRVEGAADEERGRTKRGGRTQKIVAPPAASAPEVMAAAPVLELAEPCEIEDPLPYLGDACVSSEGPPAPVSLGMAEESTTDCPVLLSWTSGEIVCPSMQNDQPSLMVSGFPMVAYHQIASRFEIGREERYERMLSEDLREAVPLPQEEPKKGSLPLTSMDDLLAKQQSLMEVLLATMTGDQSEEDSTTDSSSARRSSGEGLVRPSPDQCLMLDGLGLGGLLEEDREMLFDSHSNITGATLENMFLQREKFCRFADSLLREEAVGPPSQPALHAIEPESLPDCFKMEVTRTAILPR